MAENSYTPPIYKPVVDDSGVSDSIKNEDTSIVDDIVNKKDEDLIEEDESHTEHQLIWERLDKNDKIEELIEKMNFNFAQFAMHNGGNPGIPGKNGIDGYISMSRCGIHTIILSDDDKENILTGNIELPELISDKLQEQGNELYEGDLVICENYIFIIKSIDNSDDNITISLTTISEIKGEKGDKGDTLSSELEFDKINFNGNRYTFKESVGLILANKKEFLKQSSSDENAITIPSDQISNNQSLIFAKDNDGFSFFKIKKDDNDQSTDSLIRVVDTTINHKSIHKDNSLTSDETSFIIDDNSTEGTYINATTQITLSSKVKKDDNKTDHYISIGKNDTSSQISIHDKEQIIIEAPYVNIESSSIKLGDMMLLSTDTNGIVTLNINVNESNFKNLNVDNINVKNLNVSTKLSIGDNKIDLNGGYFNQLYIKDKDITDIFGKKYGGLLQFASKDKTDDNSRKLELRNEIDAISKSEVELIIKGETPLPSGVPIGTVIMSVTTGFYYDNDNKFTITEKKIITKSGEVYLLCDGNEYKKSDYPEYAELVDAINEVSSNANTYGYGTFSSDWKTFTQMYTPDTFKVPDLRSRFIVGFNNSKSISKPYCNMYIMNQIGGETYYTLSENQIPKHRHLFVCNDEVSGTFKNNNYPASDEVVQSYYDYHSGKRISGGGSDNSRGDIGFTSFAGGNRSNVEYNYWQASDYINSGIKKGDTVPFDNRPPYYALAFFVKVGFESKK